MELLATCQHVFRAVRALPSPAAYLRGRLAWGLSSVLPKQWPVPVSRLGHCHPKDGQTGKGRGEGKKEGKGAEREGRGRGKKMEKGSRGEGEERRKEKGRRGGRGENSMGMEKPGSQIPKLVINKIPAARRTEQW